MKRNHPGAAVARLLALLCLAALPAVQASTADLSEAQADRYQKLVTELRCLVCQNQSIDDSDAELAKDLRLIVRERLVAGDSDTEVVQYVVDRYGEFVLLKPVMAPHTILLWAAAPLVLIVGGIAVLIGVRKRRPSAMEALPPTLEEARALDELRKG
jgi:cytochrome c-type biogenesis protein CcmH